MKKRHDTVLLLDMLTAIKDAEASMTGVDREEFLRNRDKQGTILYRIVVIGEASHGLSNAFIDAHPEIPWGNIVGTRNRVVHGYFDVNLEGIWDITQSDIPALKTWLLDVLGPEAESEL